MFIVTMSLIYMFYIYIFMCANYTLVHSCALSGSTLCNAQGSSEGWDGGGTAPQL